jgi:membrane-bound lytic murein transglycosylase B
VAVALVSSIGGGVVGASHSHTVAPPVVAKASWATAPRPSAYAVKTIPTKYLHLYWRVAAEYGLDWTKLAAVGQIESNHGRLPAPGVASGTNRAGAAGPAQFIAGTWARFGVDPDGQGQLNPYDPVDAITAMAAYLKASGAPQHWRRALYAYNHSLAYVHRAMTLSHRFLGARITPH